MSSSQEQQERSGSGSGSNQRQKRIGKGLLWLQENFGSNVVSIALGIASVWFLTFLIGSPLSVEGVAMLAVLGAGVSLLSTRTGEFSWQFILVTISLAVPLWHLVVPASVASIFEPMLGLIPIGLGGLTPLQFAAAGLVVVLVAWAANIRVFSAFVRKSGRPEAANADTLVRAITRRLRKLARVYIAILVALGTFVAAFAFDLLVGGAELGGNAFEFIGQAPVVAAAIVSDAIGWLALDGGAFGLENVPVLGAVVEFAAGLGPTGFGVLAGFLLVLAIVSRRNR